MRESKLNKAWNSLFQDFKILEQINNFGFYEINAVDIKKYREPRLAAKFDSSVQLPDLFKENNLGIFPINRKKYLIGKFNMFEVLTIKDQEPILKTAKNNYQSLDINKITTESEAIQIAYLYKLIQEFLNDYDLVPTFFGKKSVGKFDFNVKSMNNQIQKVSIDGAMMEVDGSFESNKNYAIVEAKLLGNKDFHIRQLFFPYRYFETKISKNIRLVFMMYIQKTAHFEFFEYAFDDSTIYNSIKLIRSKTYKFI